MKTKWLITIVLLTIWILPMDGRAAPINKGFDLFNVKNAKLDINLNGNLKTLKLKGDPKVKGVKGADLIIGRTTGLSSEGTGIINTETVALSLASVAPVDLGVAASSFFDVFVSVEYPTIPNRGTLNVTEHDDGNNGGTAVYNFPVLSLLVNFVSLSNGISFEHRVDARNLESDIFSWSHEHPPSAPSNPSLPSGGFYPPDELRFNSSIFSISAALVSVPEASTLVLLGTGLLMLGIGRRRSKAAAG